MFVAGHRSGCYSINTNTLRAIGNIPLLFIALRRAASNPGRMPQTTRERAHPAPMCIATE
jgi:hypothetical protein